MDILEHLTQLDAGLLVGNIIFGIAGANIGSILISNDLNNPINELTDKKGTNSTAHVTWSISRIVVGATYSLVISLFAAGSFSDNIYEVLKVFGFTLVTSAFAPKLWMAQEKRFLKIIDDRIKQHEKS